MLLKYHQFQFLFQEHCFRSNLGIQFNFSQNLLNLLITHFKINSFHNFYLVVFDSISFQLAMKQFIQHLYLSLMIHQHLCALF